MNKLKRMTILAAVLCSLSISAYAEAIPITGSGEIQNTGNTSNQQVNVIKKNGDRQTVVYSGSLAGYAGGCFEKADLSKADFMIVFEWGESNDTLYIVPAETSSADAVLTNAEITAETNTTAESGNPAVSGSISTNIALMYNDKYYENVLIPGQTLTVPITITNNSGADTEIIPYIAQYDLSGKLSDVTQYSAINAVKNSSVTQFLTKEFESGTACTAKIFLWQKSGLIPVTDSIAMTAQSSDFYSDTYSGAIKADISKPISGVINTDTDIDIVKFTPSETGLYAIQPSGTPGTLCGLYSNNCTLLNSAPAAEDKNYLLYSLTAGSDYYIRMSGAANASYEIAAAAPGEIQNIVKNTGCSDTLPEGNDFNVYKFTPSAAGSYIITAVGSTGVNAALYNASFEKLSSGNTDDNSVSFRITNNMAANQDYYIVVYPKAESASESYSIYVEEPFNVISVQ